MTAAHCLNCGAALAASARFCAQCSQRTDTDRLTFADLWRDLMHTFVNIERGPLAFAWALVTRPGVIAREYVEGKRRRHYGPFATLVVLVGLTALTVNVSGFQALSHDGLPPGPSELLQRHFNLLLLVQLPFLGASCGLLFLGERMSLPEHMVLAAYAFSVRAVATALLIGYAFTQSEATPSVGYFYAFWGAWYVYFGWAASQFYRGSRWASWFKGTLAAILEHALAMGFLIAVSSAYEALVAR